MNFKKKKVNRYRRKARKMCNLCFDCTGCGWPKRIKIKQYGFPEDWRTQWILVCT